MHIRDLIKENRLFDSHAHLNFEGYDNDREEVVQRALDNGVEVIYDIGTDIEASKKSVELAKKFKGIVFSFIGIDPEIFLPGSEMFIGLDKDDKWISEQKKVLQEIISQNKEYVAGIGESGMDFFRLGQLLKEVENEDKKTDVSETVKASMKLQLALFRMHLELAKEFNLPVSIHSRGAEKECLEVVKQYPDTTGIFHSYTGDFETAQGILEAGWGLGINGIATFKNAKVMRDMYSKILGDTTNLKPADFYNKGIFFETDSPFLSPEGKRGDRNEPSNIRLIFDLFVHKT